jgi:hypothetical protein
MRKPGLAWLTLVLHYGGLLAECIESIPEPNVQEH